MLNELHGGYYRLNYPSVIPTPVQNPSALGFGINPQLPLAGIPYISLGGYFSWATAARDLSRARTRT